MRPIHTKVRPLVFDDQKQRYNSQIRGGPIVRITKKNSRNTGRDLSNVSKDSGTNVSFNSSYSAIKKDITRFKNKNSPAKKQKETPIKPLR
jgi:hypothetical protein